VAATNPGATQRLIAEKLDMSEASAGRLIDRLEAEGLLERRERQDDRRARAVFLTEAANPLLQRMGMVARAREERMFRGMEPEELARMSALIDKLYQNFIPG
jgi:DNA-binding MarR family transcriptional regulator